MSCFFGHKFGKIEADGYQYCTVCGKASKPKPIHPCINGHKWVEESRLGWSGWSEFSGHWKDWQIAERCNACGENRTRWLFGH